jgi:hypothetical protein
MPHQSTRKSLAERFWPKVDRSGGPAACWPWLAHIDKNGYGRINSGGTGGRCLLASHVAWELTHGPIPPGLFVLHNCPGGDNPACVNPAHLWLGTQRDNMRDMHRKGRASVGERHYLRQHPELVRRGERHHSRTRPGCMPRGEANHAAKLTADAVREIRARFAAGGVTQTALAREYGVDFRSVSQIIRRKRWQHIP